MLSRNVMQCDAVCKNHPSRTPAIVMSVIAIVYQAFVDTFSRVNTRGMKGNCE